MKSEHFVNLTPHNVRLYTIDGAVHDLEPCANPARAVPNQQRVTTVLGVPVLSPRNDADIVVVGLPDRVEGTYYLVSRMVRDAVPPERDDLFVPSRLIKKPNGAIEGCTAISL